jgi:large subunit ribosomal protein L16
MLQPTRTKFRKSHRGKNRGAAHAGFTLHEGDFGLKAMESYWITSRQIEAARKTIAHHIKRGGNIVIRIFPDRPVTARPLETRMGGGKGAVDHYAAVVKRGRILFELVGVDEATAKEAMKLASAKLPIKTKFVVRHEVTQAAS